MSRNARNARLARDVHHRAVRDLLLFFAVFALLCILIFWLAGSVPAHGHWAGDGHAH